MVEKSKTATGLCGWHGNEESSLSSDEFSYSDS
jgi:hypothetical protein